MLPEKMNFTKIDLGMITEAWSTNKRGKLVILRGQLLTAQLFTNTV
jgi:hypothetical protein